MIATWVLKRVHTEHQAVWTRPSTTLSKELLHLSGRLLRDGPLTNEQAALQWLLQLQGDIEEQGHQVVTALTPITDLLDTGQNILNGSGLDLDDTWETGGKRRGEQQSKNVVILCVSPR